MPVSYDLTGRTAVVTGGSKGIGRATADRLKGFGARVWVWDISLPCDIDEVGFAPVDVTNADQIARAVEQVLAETSRIDILVNNAGFIGISSSVEEADPAQWRRVIEVNLTGVFEVARQVVPIMRRTGWGRIVNMASLAGKGGNLEPLGLLRRQGGRDRLHEVACQGACRHKHPGEQCRPSRDQD
jgi:NAD(P)-dependent dehydrogenase (short-subunit alcohol dehydrogenase family)